MGTTYSNCQVRSDSQNAVADALEPLLKEPAYVSPSVGGWVGVYPEGDSDVADKLAKKLSAKLGCGVFFWSVYDSDIFFYTLYESGKLRDEFDSNPDYFETISTAKKARLRGKPEALVHYCLPGVGYSQVQEVLHPAALPEPNPAPAALPSGFSDRNLQLMASALNTTLDALKQGIDQQGIDQKKREKYIFAEDQANDLAALLGIKDELANAEYSVVEEDELEDLTKAEFRLVSNEGLSQEHKDRKIVLDVELMRHPEKMQEWLKKGANSSARDSAGVPVLFRWAEVCLPEQVGILLKAGADVNAQTDGQMSYERGMTALMVAVGRSYEQPGRMIDTVKLLIEAGADVNIRSESGRTVLGEAMAMTDWRNHRLKLSRAAPEDVLRKLAGWSAEIVEMLRAAGATE